MSKRKLRRRGPRPKPRYSRPYVPVEQRKSRTVSKKTTAAQLKKYIQRTKHRIEFTKNPDNQVYAADEVLITLNKRLANYENELKKRKRT